MSLRNRLSILVGLALLPPIGLLTYDALETRQRERQALLDEARHEAQLVAGQLEAIIHGSRRLSWALAHQTRIIRADSRCPEHLRSIVDTIPLYRAGIVTDATGKVVCSWPRSPEGATLGDRDYFRQAMEQPGMVVGTLILRGRVTGASALPMARQYLGNGAPGGVIVLGLDLDLLARSFRERYGRQNRALSVVDSAGTLILHVAQVGEVAGRKLSAEEVSRFAGTAGSLEGTDLSGRPALIGFARAEGLLVSVSYERASALAPLRQSTWRNMLLMALVLLLAIGAAWIAGERLVRRPIKRLVKAARRQEAGERHVRFPKLGETTELGKLSRALNRMAAANEQLLNQRDILMRELQHRVMNSLQLLASFLQLQARNADPATREQLAVARERIVSMSTIFRYLYRAELASTVEFGAFLESFCRDTARAYLGPDSPQLEVTADTLKISLEQALSLALITHELITNAVKHGFAPGAKGKIRVLFRVRPEGGSELVVADNGSGIPKDFDVNRSKSLGMILVQRLTQSLHGQVGIESSKDGTTITISMPSPSPAPA